MRRTSPRSGRTPADWAMALAGTVLLSFALAGCGILSGSVEPLPAKPGVDIVLHPAGGLVPSKADTTRATDVISNRLRSIGVDNFAIDAGNDIKISVGTSDNLAKIQTAVRSTGIVAFGALPADATPPRAGSRFVITSPLWEGSGVEQSSFGTDQNGAPTIDFVLSAAATAAFAAYSAAHVTQPFVITLDGVVVAAPMITSPIGNGQVEISFADPVLMPADVLAAILNSGPLPDAWRQP
jgi:SecDF, P1 head subdomain